MWHWLMKSGQVTAIVVDNGEVAAGAPEAIRMVTLSFLIGTPNPSQPGGFNRPDGFKFAEYIAADPGFADRVDLDPDSSGADDVASRTGVATFTDNGREQDALAEYLANKFSITRFSEARHRPGARTGAYRTSACGRIQSSTSAPIDRTEGNDV